MMAPDPLIQNNAHYGNFVELNISFQLRLHKPPPEAYTLTLDDVEVLGRDEPYRVGHHEGIRVVPFELRQCPCFGSFGFGTPHDAELESWFFLYSGFLTCVGQERNASCFGRPV